MNKATALRKVKEGFSERLYQYIGKGNWRVFSHDIFGGFKTTVVRKIPDRAFAEHKATGARMVFHDGFFHTEAVSEGPHCDLEDSIRELDRTIRRSRRRTGKAEAVGSVAGAILDILLDD